MSDFAFPPAATPSVAVAAADERFPVHRIYCVGLNYADHIREMGADPEAPPLFFMKPADALVANGAAIPYPPANTHLHLRDGVGGCLRRRGRGGVGRDRARARVRYRGRNRPAARQSEARGKEPRGAVDTAKGFDCSAPVAAIRPAAQ